MKSANIKVIFAAIAGNTAIAVTKLSAAFITGSSAMLSEGIHSLVDTGNQGLLLYGIRRAKRPPDPQYPFGYGKEIYFWSFMVAIGIFALGAGVSIYEGIDHILHPDHMKDPLINYFVLGAALVFEGFSWTVAFREFGKIKGKLSYIEAIRRGKDPSMFVVLFEDSAAIVGLLVALLGIGLAQITGIPWFDGAASIVIGLILAFTALLLATETKSLLIGESASQEILTGIRRIVSQERGVVGVKELLTLHMGPDFILVTMAVDFRDALDAPSIEETIARIDRAIKRDYPEVKKIFIEAESLNVPKHEANAHA